MGDFKDPQSSDLLIIRNPAVRRVCKFSWLKGILYLLSQIFTKFVTIQLALYQVCVYEER